MIKSQKIRLQKILYGTFFILVLPLYFIFLANSVSLTFEVPELGYGGSVTAIIGLAIIIRGMYELKVKGKGLPMNAFPPRGRNIWYFSSSNIFWFLYYVYRNFYIL